MDFKVGDIVRLKSEPNVLMTVREVSENEITVNWFDTNNMSIQATFKKEQLLFGNIPDK